MLALRVTFCTTNRFWDIGGAKSPLISGTSPHITTLPLSLQRRLVTDRLRVWQLGGRCDRGVTLTVTSGDLDLLLWHWHTFKGKFSKSRSRSTPTIAFRSKPTSNLSIASYSRRAKGVPVYMRLFFAYDLPFRDVHLRRLVSFICNFCIRPTI